MASKRSEFNQPTNSFQGKTFMKHDSMSISFEKHTRSYRECSKKQSKFVVLLCSFLRKKWFPQNLLGLEMFPQGFL